MASLCLNLELFSQMEVYISQFGLFVSEMQVYVTVWTFLFRSLYHNLDVPSQKWTIWTLHIFSRLYHTIWTFLFRNLSLYIIIITIELSKEKIKNYTGLNTGQRWVTYGQTQRLGYCPEGWFKHLTQLLVENNPIAGFVHILPSAGLYLTQHFYSVAQLAVLP